MARRNLLWLDGDAPGSAMIAAARAVFKALGLEERYESRAGRIGWDLWLERGEAVPEETVRLCDGVAALLVGAVASGPPAGDAKDLKSRAAANPAQAADPLLQLAGRLALGLRLSEFRRYALSAEAFEMTLAAPGDTAPETGRAAARLAFESARLQSRPVLTVLGDRESPFAQPGPLAVAARALAREFPDVQIRESEVFPFCTGLLERPGLHGSVLCAPELAPAVAAIAAHLAGGAFLCATAFRDATRGCFTPLAPAPRAFAGKGHASPLGVLQALRMMLSSLGETAAAARLEGAVAHVLAEGPRTLEQGGDASSDDVTQAVLERLGAH